MQILRLAAVTILLFPAALLAQETIGLTKYFNKYPFEEVDGVKFLDHARVQKAVRNSMPTPMIQTLLLDPGNTSSPIEGVGGYMQSWACEQHNCGNHNWTIAVSYDGEKSAICYYNKDLTKGSRWFVDGEMAHEDVFYSCRTGRLPSQVSKALGDEVSASLFGI